MSKFYRVPKFCVPSPSKTRCVGFEVCSLRVRTLKHQRYSYVTHTCENRAGKDVIVRACVRNRCWIVVEGGPNGHTSKLEGFLPLWMLWIHIQAMHF